MTLSEGNTDDVATTASGLPSDEPVFSDLIDRWLREGDRLNEPVAAGEPGAGFVGPAPAAWKTRARELFQVVMERHRLPVLVGIGLVPMALFLLVAGHAAPQEAPARAMAAQVPPPVAAVPLPPPPAAALVPRVAMLVRRPITPDPLVLRAQPVAVNLPKAVTKAPAPKRAPARSHPLVAHVSHPAPPALAAKVQPAKPVAAKPAKPPAPRAAVASPKVAPAPTKAAPRPVAKPVKAAFAVDPRVAPNLKLGGARRP